MHVSLHCISQSFLSVVLAGSALLASADVFCAERDPGYHFLTEIPIEGDTGWDYLAIDSPARRLYVTHGSHIVVLDLDTNKVVGDISDTPGVHGFAIASAAGRGYSSNGSESKVSIVDLKTLATTGKLVTGDGPDAILYEPGRGEIYTFNGRAHSATVIAAESGKGSPRVIATIALPGKPEFAVADPDSSRVFVNIEDKSEVAVIDTNSHSVTHLWPITPGETASGMAFDALHHRLFIGCANRLMLMMDSTGGKVVATVSIGSGVDANVFDPQSQLAFSSNGEGTVTIAHEDSPSALTVVQTLKTQPSARTMALDPSTRRIYLAAATYRSSVPAGEISHQRRPVVAGSFKVLVYGPRH
jgi:hypothetical protein